MSKERKLLLMLIRRYRRERRLHMRIPGTRCDEVLWDRYNIVQIAREIVYGKD